MTKVLASLGLGLILACTSATAAPNSKPAEPSSSSDERVYCIKLDAPTGSHYARTECHTKAEWLRRDVDIDDLLKK